MQLVEAMLSTFAQTVGKRFEVGEVTKPHTKALQKHIPSGFCYYIKCFDEGVYNKAPVTYTMRQGGEDVARSSWTG